MLGVAGGALQLPVGEGRPCQPPSRGQGAPVLGVVGAVPVHWFPGARGSQPPPLLFLKDPLALDAAGELSDAGRFFLFFFFFP